MDSPVCHLSDRTSDGLRVLSTFALFVEMKGGLEIPPGGLRVIRVVSVTPLCPSASAEPGLTRWGFAWLSQRLWERHDTLQSAGSRLPLRPPTPQEVNSCCVHVRVLH